MFNGLRQLCKEYPNLVNSARNLGTFGSVDGQTAQVRDQLITKLRNLGIQSGACGDKSLRIRPALIFSNKHADIFLDRFRTVLKSF